MWWRLVVPSLLVLGLTAAPVTARTRWAGPSPILQVATPTPDAQGSVRPVNILLESCEVTVYGGQLPYTPPGTPAPAVASAPTWSVALDVSIANRGRRPMLYNAANFTVRLQDATTVTFGQPVLVGGMEPALRGDHQARPALAGVDLAADPGHRLQGAHGCGAHGHHAPA